MDTDPPPQTTESVSRLSDPAELAKRLQNQARAAQQGRIGPYKILELLGEGVESYS